MYKEHPAFNTPDDNRIIWRYLDFPKFLDILDRKKLFFPSLTGWGTHLKVLTQRLTWTL